MGPHTADTPGLAMVEDMGIPEIAAQRPVTARLAAAGTTAAVAVLHPAMADLVVGTAVAVVMPAHPAAVVAATRVAVAVDMAAEAIARTFLL